MSYEVDKRLFAELSKKDPESIIFPPFISYDRKQKRYAIKAWGGKYAVTPDEKKVESVDGTPRAHDYFHVFLVNYLLSEKSTKIEGEWISEKDHTGGVTFFRGPHEIPTHLISGKFNNDLDALKNQCEQIGGEPLSMADLSYGFDVIGSIRLALLYWTGDEDFPAEAKILMDGSLRDNLPLDVIYGLLCDGCIRLSSD